MTVAGLAFIVKSCIVNKTVVWCDRTPLVPVSVTAYAPATPAHDRVEVADVPSTMLVELNVHARPDDGETEAARATVPVKPLMLATVMAELPPLTTLREAGPAAKVKS